MFKMNNFLTLDIVIWVAKKTFQEQINKLYKMSKSIRFSKEVHLRIDNLGHLRSNSSNLNYSGMLKGHFFSHYHHFTKIKVC